MKKIIAAILVVASIACTCIFTTSCKSNAEKAAEAMQDAANEYLKQIS